MTNPETVEVGNVVTFAFAGRMRAGIVTHVYADARMQRFTAVDSVGTMFSNVASRKATVHELAA